MRHYKFNVYAKEISESTFFELANTGTSPERELKKVAKRIHDVLNEMKGDLSIGLVSDIDERIFQSRRNGQYETVYQRPLKEQEFKKLKKELSKLVE